MARKILLADDSVTAQNMGRRILTDAGYDVITVNNGSAALKKATEQKPDLIVLDVYMPGYGGLEVCQRLRETQDTARIPVLLTVGKLEPFKPEEAKRVRADAYVIKPFEASELLAALTKLEDRIVPEGAAPKGKNKNFDSVKGEKFGDTETGWKNRLNIPPTRKANTAEEEAAEDAAKESAKAAEPAKPAAKAEDASVPKKENKPDTATSPAQKLPADITPEEIAALASAAAVVREKGSAPASSPVVPAQASTPEAASRPTEPAKAETETKPEPATNAASEVAVSTSSEKGASNTSEKVSQQKEEDKKDEKKDADAASPSANAEPASAPEPAESEVAAVLASLTPAESKESVKEREEIPVGAFAQAVAIGASVPTGPRWIAEEIPVSGQDSSSSLEQEMEKSAQGKAPVTAAATSSAVTENALPSPVQTEPESAAPASASASEKAPESEIASAGEAKNTSTEAAAPSASTPEVTAASGAPREPAALAAAASAQPSSDAVSTEKPTAVADRQRESQLAAAWENWQTVRESILGSQLASQITEAASETLKEAQKEHPAGAETKADTSTAKPANPTAIASIVDSVLAELKPKLMEEIARKLESEKK